jgi:hypothetical protein
MEALGIGIGTMAGTEAMDTAEAGTVAPAGAGAVAAGTVAAPEPGMAEPQVVGTVAQVEAGIVVEVLGMAAVADITNRGTNIVGQAGCCSVEQIEYQQL